MAHTTIMSWTNTDDVTPTSGSKVLGAYRMTDRWEYKLLQYFAGHTWYGPDGYPVQPPEKWAAIPSPE